MTDQDQTFSEQEHAKSELIKSVHAFFGFKVKESVVLLFVDEDFMASHHLRVDNSEEAMSQIPRLVKSVPPREQSQGIICISLSEDMELAQTSLIEAMRHVLEAEGIPLDAIATNGTFWHSLTGDNGVLDDMPSELEYALAERGIFTYPSREEALDDIHRVEPSEGVLKEITNVLDTCPVKSEELPAWRKSIVEFCENYSHGILTDAEVALLAFACSDRATTGAILRHLSRTEHPQKSLHLWQQVFRRTPEEYRQVVAEVLLWALALEGSRWFIPEVLPYCNEHSATFQALMLALRMNFTPHMLSLAMNRTTMMGTEENMDSMLVPTVSSALVYLVNNRQKDY